MPDQILDMTRKELIDWLDAAIENEKLNEENRNRLAYNIGWTVASGYAAVWGSANGAVYPKFEEMFPGKLTPEEEQEQEEISWRMHRDELRANLKAAAERNMKG